MKYDSDAALQEILRRSEAIRAKKERRTIRGLASASAALLALLVAGVCLFSRTETTEGVWSVYGAFLLPAEAGGYVLAAVAAFVIGVVVTVACVRYREKKGRNNG